MKNKKYIIIGIAVILIALSIKIYNDYKEKALDDAIGYNLSAFDSLEVSLQWKTEDKAYAEELIEFLSQYRVKK